MLAQKEKEGLDRKKMGKIYAIPRVLYSWLMKLSTIHKETCDG